MTILNGRSSIFQDLTQVPGAVYNSRPPHDLGVVKQVFAGLVDAEVFNVID